MGRATVICMMLLAPMEAWGYGNDDLEEASKETENPLSGIVNLQLVNSTNYLIGPNERARNILALSPIIPLRLGSFVTLNASIRVPLVWNPLGMTANDSAFGLADIGLNLPFSTTLKNLYYIGIGPNFLFPTATDNRLGKSVSGKFSLGPAATFEVTPRHLVLGVSVSNVWSVAGQKSGRTVNQFSLMPSITWNLPRGYHLITSLPVSADWAASNGDRWTVPWGGGVGAVKLFTKTVGINLEVQAFWNILQTSVDGLWQLRFLAALFFPTFTPRR